MAEQGGLEWRLHSGNYLGEISALCFLDLPSHLSSHPYLLAGSGSQILLYDLSSGKLIRSFQVFKGIRVHGVTCGSIERLEGTLSNKVACKLVLFGEKRVKLFNLSFELELRSGSQRDVVVDLTFVHSLAKFSHWVLDVCFLKGCIDSLHEEECLAIGCSDNSVHIWEIKGSSLILEVQSPERCLLYSMRLWGDNLLALRIASGTIYNEIVVWKLVLLNGDKSLTTPVGDQIDLRSSLSDGYKLNPQHYEAVNLSRLIGHEGSIFRIVWSSDGSKLVSVSDDRSARVWAVDSELNDCDNSQEFAGPVLFGHSARVWDCSISDSLIVTAGEDCTCRVWELKGKQLEMIKEHIGRGIWRCLHEPKSSLLVTAGFDSAIKVHFLDTSLYGSFLEAKGSTDKTELLTASIPNYSQHLGLVDSKSEYVRCMHFTREDTMYVATNHGYLYHAKLTMPGNIKWTKLVRISEEGPIICMDLLPCKVAKISGGLDDWVALGDGKGNMTVVQVIGDISDPAAGFTLKWSAELERQLLGTFWCRSLGYKYIFTANPRGMLKLWRLSGPVASDSASTNATTLLAEFSSCFGRRIMCLDASYEDEVLICGDLRGNLVLFTLSKDLLMGTPASELNISPMNYFKGVHGISTVSSLSAGRLSPDKIEIRSTGADGCICYLEYDRDRRTLEFMGLKQVKELSLVQSVSTHTNSFVNKSDHEYAAGFASTDFILWNLTTETKVVQISCGGWRRPHTFCIGDVPEMKNCFAYVKDEVIHIHRYWLGEDRRKIPPRNLHMQFHGREIHSLCFVSGSLKVALGTASDKSSWIATGCEDGTVRLTRYASEVENWSTSELLGEHVGGSAVRSVCFVLETHIVAPEAMGFPNSGQAGVSEEKENPCLLISVGAKRVLTSWLLRDGRVGEKEKTHVGFNDSENGHKPSSGEPTSLTFQWLSTDMPAKSSGLCRRKENSKDLQDLDQNEAGNAAKGGADFHENGKMASKSCPEDDWRYMAVTSFLVKCAGSRLTICFVVVACSDATLVLRALVLPLRLWFDVAILGPLSSPVLALQHVIVPLYCLPEDSMPTSSVYVIISGATDGSIAFWDLTKSVEAFVRQLTSLQLENFIDHQKRPRTGRGSQGGRSWKSLDTSMAKKKQGQDSNFKLSQDKLGSDTDNHAAHRTMHGNSSEKGVNITNYSSDVIEIYPVHILSKAHQSGVNCLSVSRSCQNFDHGSMFHVISGGDDQALHCLRFDVTSSVADSGTQEAEIDTSQNQTWRYKFRLLDHQGIASAHSSAIKGVWTDGTWVFSTGLDQRIRCWFLKEKGGIIEHTHLVVSVPEPEALDARACGKNRYQIAVAGRGMQMAEFCLTDNDDE